MDLKLMIGVPSGETWHRLFGLSLAMTMGSLTSGVEGFNNVFVSINNHKGSILSRSRERLVENALKGQYTHLLFVDTDMVFPHDTVKRLLAHRKWVVAANCATKMIPSSPTARKKSEQLGGDVVYTDPTSTGLEKVWRIGTGVMLLDMKVFTRIQKPWFPVRYIPELNDYMGEDWGFMEKLEEKGIAVYIDHDVSKQVGHVGEFTYTHEYVGEVQSGNSQG